VKRAGGGNAGKIDRKNDRYPQRDGQDRQRSPHGLSEERTHHQSVKEQEDWHFSAG